MGADLHNTERELEDREGWADGEGVMKGHMEGWGEQEHRLYAWELTAWKLSGFSDPPHRKQSVFPRKEQPGTLNTEKQTDKYTLPNIHTLGEKNCFRMRSINLWLDPDYGWWCKWWVRLHVWHTRYLSLNTLSIRLPHNFHLWMLIRGCDNVYTAVTKKTTLRADEAHSDSLLSVNELSRREWLVPRRDKETLSK